jgi:hypothetical protein
MGYVILHEYNITLDELYHLLHEYVALEASQDSASMVILYNGNVSEVYDERCPHVV